jgi:pimeloyl-ACP methyl ester carboxylesterase
MAAKIEPFSISVADEALTDLRERLRRTRFPDSVENPDGLYGIDLDLLGDLRDHWLHRFDWRSVERTLNSLSSFRYRYRDGELHFLHIRGKCSNPLPLLFIHGWPGSVLEALKLIPLLTQPSNFGASADDGFDVIVPSLPGFGFSSASIRPGMNTFVIARLFSELMTELGYSRFVAQGGDFGAGVSTILGLKYPDRLHGVHLNYIPGSYQPYLTPGESPTPEEAEYLAGAGRWYEEHGAYAHVQRREPQTLAAALNDSPMGLAAWIVDKFVRWSDCEDDVFKRFSMDELLANVTLYWVTQSIGSSCRLYVESRLAPLQLGKNERVTVPTAIARLPKEIPMPPRPWVERGYNVTRWTDLPSGGHFAAMEEPELLAQDLREFCRSFRT